MSYDRELTERVGELPGGPRARYTEAQLDAAVEAIFDASADLARLGFELHSITADPEPEGLVIEGADGRFPNSDDDEPLEPRLVAAVADHIGRLDAIGTVFRREDVRIEPGRVHLA